MLLLTNALILDGTGTPPIAGSVLLRDGLILDAGRIAREPTMDVLDAQGSVIAPGFLDLHSHSDLKVLENRREKSDQGITTEVVGNCGFSPYPCGHHAALLAEQNEGILNGGACWPTAATYLADVRRASRLVRVESLIGHGALRTAICGTEAASTGLVRLEALESALDEALAEGAIGFSTGLMYAPGSQAPFAELEALCRVTARRNKLYTTHMRSYSWELLESIDEQISLARRTGCRLQISHLQAVGRDNWHKQRLALDKIEQAHAEGIDIGFDCYPYLAGSTVMTQLLPQTALANGLTGMLALIASPSTRAGLETFLNEQTAQAWTDIFISSLHTPANRPILGQTISAIAESRNATPASTVLDLLTEELGRVNIVAFNQSESNLRELLAHPSARSSPTASTSQSAPTRASPEPSPPSSASSSASAAGSPSPPPSARSPRSPPHASSSATVAASLPASPPTSPSSTPSSSEAPPPSTIRRSLPQASTSSSEDSEFSPNRPAYWTGAVFSNQDRHFRMLE